MKNTMILIAILSAITVFSQKKSKDIDRKWWKEAVVYQIYPRSFKDTNGDGVGDLKGIISKLDYIKSLGINAIWLNPIFESPNADNGYDISDYQSIMKQFGTMDDFNTLLKDAHQKDLKIILDLVVNHSSDEHKWFQESRKSRDNPYRDYYHWWPAEKGKPAFRPGAFEADGSGWRYDKTTNSYYLHYFNFKQPDLNWENPKVRQEIYSMMRFWLDKGIDGFRMDVIPFISKDTNFPVITQADLDKNYHGRWDVYMGEGPHLHDYLKEMNKEVLSKYPNAMSLAEGAGMLKSTALNFVDPARHELNMGYHFEGTNLGYVPRYFKKSGPYKLTDFKKIYTDWDAVYKEKGWGTTYLGNHDQPRMVSRWGNDSEQFRAPSSKMLTTFLLSMTGTPYYYYGDELGMTNIKFDKIEDYRDIEVFAEYDKVKNAGGDLKEFIENQKTGGARDNGRTPMQWNEKENAGFTTGTPWLKVNANKSEINVLDEEKNPNSTLNYFKKMTKTRRENLALIYGKYTLVDEPNEQIYAYTKELDGKKLLVVLNFSDKEAKLNSDLDLKNAKILIENYPSDNKTGTFQPYEAVIYQLK
ncbi:glycoside hydrolase family 13 protein [Halpernia frigidisoli]|uniref:Oligo-1,6-glucosidase n=1 Tax=Halpernia frigidisoli TaxID=1125876 RepID=A0A1I3H259_9FLAO|nr:alpha-glucosidase [Halpernia frigidisoli]SFI29617.1 oligo-1,6-glucosidase [Halpernia frigidisoli]